VDLAKTHALFPLERPFKGECASEFEFDDLRGVVKLHCLVLARRARRRHTRQK